MVIGFRAVSQMLVNLVRLVGKVVTFIQPSDRGGENQTITRSLSSPPLAPKLGQQLNAS